jgi:hypothetical protein
MELLLNAIAWRNSIYFSIELGVTGVSYTIEYGETEALGKVFFTIYTSLSNGIARRLYNLDYNKTYYYRGKAVAGGITYYTDIMTIDTDEGSYFHDPTGDGYRVSGTGLIVSGYDSSGQVLRDSEGDPINFVYVSAVSLVRTFSHSGYICGGYDFRYFSFPPYTGTDFTAVRVHTLISNERDNTASMVLKRVSTGEEYDAGSISPTWTTKQDGHDYKEFLTNPFTGVAWTKADIADTKVGIYLETGGSFSGIALNYVTMELLGAKYVMGKSGYLWVEGETLRYTDSEGAVRVLTGTPIVDYLTSLEEE